MTSNSGKAPSFKGLRPSSEASSRSKRSNRAHDTKPELILRRALWRLGLRYRKNVTTLPGKPDIVFPGAKVAIFCDGDFWHGKDWEQRKVKLSQGSNAEYWIAKIQRNIDRDRKNTSTLERQGWQVIRLWESAILRNPAALAAQVQEVVVRRRRLHDRKVTKARRSCE